MAINNDLDNAYYLRGKFRNPITMQDVVIVESDSDIETIEGTYLDIIDYNGTNDPAQVFEYWKANYQQLRLVKPCNDFIDNVIKQANENVARKVIVRCNTIVYDNNTGLSYLRQNIDACEFLGIVARFGEF